LDHSNLHVALLVSFLLQPMRMATAPPLPAPAVLPAQATDAADAVSIAAEQALAPSPLMPGEENLMRLSAPLSRLPVELNVAVAVRDFRVRNLLVLEPGHVLETEWGHGDDVPLTSGKVQLAWSEFEVVDDSKLAVRVTRLI
jgi:flagellar motor switch protein FliN/FliY